MKGWITSTMVFALAATAFSQTRPRDPWVYRTALNLDNASRPSGNKNRLVAVLLNANFTAFYSTENGGLFMTRTGTAKDNNSAYTQTTYGQVQTFSGGAILHQNKAAALWDFQDNGATATSRTVFRGYTLKGNAVTFRYSILASANTVEIAETPEYVAGGSGGIRRAIAVSGLGTGQSVRLKLNGGVATETWTAQSGGAISGTNPMYLTISANGTATLNGTWN
ncbi:MAG: hypothetical protein JF616_06090 [Fibrobacteres bacterium]|nr:hypothetical protein [Fibrobacterota bacterium]